MTRRFGPYAVDASNPDKVLFPDDGLTKSDLIDYYVAVSAAMLPHVEQRPLALQRFPDGIGAEGFYQKQVGGHFPSWIETVRVAKEGGHQDLCVAANRATLAFLADQACITLHAWLSRVDRVDEPDLLVLDLDPSGDDFAPVRRTAFRARALFEELGLAPFAKLTGSRGVHVVCPLRRGDDFDGVRAFARRCAALLAARHPDELTTEQRKANRRGRIFLDVGRNAYAQTAVAPYSVRARPGAPVAVPVEWDELKSTKLGPRRWTLRDVPRRLERDGDPWRGMRRHARGLAGPRAALESLEAEG